MLARRMMGAGRRLQLARPLLKAAQPARAISHGSADLDWQSMLFDYVPTNCHVEYTWRDGEWDEGVVRDTPTVEMHIMSNVMHYGQSLFEGLKAFSGADGEVRVFQPYGAAAPWIPDTVIAVPLLSSSPPPTARSWQRGEGDSS